LQALSESLVVSGRMLGERVAILSWSISLLGSFHDQGDFSAGRSIRRRTPVLWLAIVAYPLWATDRLAGSSAEGTTSAFLWVILPIIAVPWRYVAVNYFYRRGT